jgi:hypothetical protein
VTCADPRRCASRQYVAVASQKLTRPGTTDPPALTVAVSVTVVPLATLFAAEPPTVTASVVVVAVATNACATGKNAKAAATVAAILRAICRTNRLRICDGFATELREGRGEKSGIMGSFLRNGDPEHFDFKRRKATHFNECCHETQLYEKSQEN